MQVAGAVFELAEAVMWQCRDSNAQKLLFQPISCIKVFALQTDRQPKGHTLLQSHFASKFLRLLQTQPIWEFELNLLQT